MKTTTNYALPYPESGDHTRTWEHWQGLADAVDALLKSKFVERAADGSAVIITGGVSRPLPFAQAALLVNGNVAASNFAVQAFTFPASRFTVPPVLVATAASWPFNVSIYGATTAAGGNVAWIHNDGQSVTQALSAHVHAVQMTPTTAPAADPAESAPGTAEVVATCRTGGCPNADIPLTITVMTVDPMGNPMTPSVSCGVCGQPITDLVTP